MGASKDLYIKIRTAEVAEELQEQDKNYVTNNTPSKDVHDEFDDFVEHITF